MNTTKSTKITVIAIGAIAIIAGFYFLSTGKSFDDYWLSFFSGIVLIGSMLIPSQHKEKC